MNAPLAALQTNSRFSKFNSKRCHFRQPLCVLGGVGGALCRGRRVAPVWRHFALNCTYLACDRRCAWIRLRLVLQKRGGACGASLHEARADPQINTCCVTRHPIISRRNHARVRVFKPTASAAGPWLARHFNRDTRLPSSSPLTETSSL